VGKAPVEAPRIAAEVIRQPFDPRHCDAVNTICRIEQVIAVLIIRVQYNDQLCVSGTHDH